MCGWHPGVSLMQGVVLAVLVGEGKHKDWPMDTEERSFLKGTHSWGSTQACLLLAVQRTRTNGTADLCSHLGSVLHRDGCYM